MQTSRQRSRAGLIAAVLITSLLLAACGGGGEEVPAQQCYVDSKPVISCEVTK